MSDQLDIAALKELCAKATPGPWRGARDEQKACKRCEALAKLLQEIDLEDAARFCFLTDDQVDRIQAALADRPAGQEEKP